MSTDTTGRVYFAKAGPHVKIGWSADPEKRLDGMQTANANELVLLGSIRGTVEDERALHAAFEDLHERGEWFRAEPRLLGFIEWVVARDTFMVGLIRAAKAHIDAIERQYADLDDVLEKSMVQTRNLVNGIWPVLTKAMLESGVRPDLATLAGHPQRLPDDPTAPWDLRPIQPIEPGGPP